MTAWTNQLYFGDNLSVLREHIPGASVDLIYLDPPFNSNATYNVLFKERSGEDSAAQIMAFDDTWHWTSASELAYREVLLDGPEQLGKLLKAMREFLGQNDMMAYLTMMAQRLTELHRVLKPTGSIYLHCDPTASHYLKLLMDAVFGADLLRREVIWQRAQAHGGSTNFNSVHDTLLYYSKSRNPSWNPQYLPHTAEYIESHYRQTDPDGRRYQLVAAHGAGPGPARQFGDRTLEPPRGRHWAWDQDRIDQLMAEGRIVFTRTGTPRYKRYLDDTPGRPAPDVWTDISPVNSQAAERIGYPTQKPEALLERIVEASSNEGDVVLDPFCGCGTAVAVAEQLKRRWVGIDITHLAISLMKHRLKDTFGTDLSDYSVVGLPEDVESARALAEDSKNDGRYQFEYWALGLVDARPTTGKKGADSGVDGYINFFDDQTGEVRRIIVQVKSGKVNRGMIATLKGDMEREEAAIGVFITLEEPTEPMRQEALGAGFYESPGLSTDRYHKVQILTIEELLEGAQAKYPRFASPQTFRRAPRRRRRQGVQRRLEE